MRKFLYLIVFVMFTSANAQAQSLNDLFRSLIGGSAEASEPAKVVFPSEAVPQIRMLWLNTLLKGKVILSQHFTGF
jgi:hypothetical protein